MEQRTLKCFGDSRIYDVKDPKHYLPLSNCEARDKNLSFYIQCLAQGLAQSEHSKTLEYMCQVPNRWQIHDTVYGQELRLSGLE